MQPINSTLLFFSLNQTIKMSKEYIQMDPYISVLHPINARLEDTLLMQTALGILIFLPLLSPGYPISHHTHTLIQEYLGCRTETPDLCLPVVREDKSTTVNQFPRLGDSRLIISPQQRKVNQRLHLPAGGFCFLKEE